MDKTLSNNVLDIFPELSAEKDLPFFINEQKFFEYLTTKANTGKVNKINLSPFLFKYTIQNFFYFINEDQFEKEETIFQAFNLNIYRVKLNNKKYFFINYNYNKTDIKQLLIQNTFNNFIFPNKNRSLVEKIFVLNKNKVGGYLCELPNGSFLVNMSKTLNLNDKIVYIKLIVENIESCVKLQNFDSRLELETIFILKDQIIEDLRQEPLENYFIFLNRNFHPINQDNKEIKSLLIDQISYVKDLIFKLFHVLFNPSFDYSKDFHINNERDLYKVTELFEKINFGEVYKSKIATILSKLLKLKDNGELLLLNVSRLKECLMQLSFQLSNSDEFNIPSEKTPFYALKASNSSKNYSTIKIESTSNVNPLKMNYNKQNVEKFSLISNKKQNEICFKINNLYIEQTKEIYKKLPTKRQNDNQISNTITNLFIEQKKMVIEKDSNVDNYLNNIKKNQTHFKISNIVNNIFIEQKKIFAKISVDNVMTLNFNDRIEGNKSQRKKLDSKFETQIKNAFKNLEVSQENDIKIQNTRPPFKLDFKLNFNKETINYPKIFQSLMITNEQNLNLIKSSINSFNKSLDAQKPLRKEFSIMQEDSLCFIRTKLPFNLSFKLNTTNSKLNIFKDLSKSYENQLSILSTKSPMKVSFNLKMGTVMNGVKNSLKDYEITNEEKMSLYSNKKPLSLMLNLLEKKQFQSKRFDNLKILDEASLYVPRTRIPFDLSNKLNTDKEINNKPLIAENQLVITSNAESIIIKRLQTKTSFMVGKILDDIITQKSNKSKLQISNQQEITFKKQRKPYILSNEEDFTYCFHRAPYKIIKQEFFTFSFKRPPYEITKEEDFTFYLQRIPMKISFNVIGLRKLPLNEICSVEHENYFSILKIKLPLRINFNLECATQTLPITFKEQQEERISSIIHIINNKLSDFGDDLIMYYLVQGDMHFESNTYLKALEYYEKSLKGNLARFGNADKNTGLSYIKCGLVYNKLRDYDKSLDHYNQALKIFENSYKEDHKVISNLLNSMALVYEKICDYVNSVIFYKKSLKIVRKVFGSNHISTASALFNVGKSYDLHDNIEKSLKYFKKAKTIYSEIEPSTEFVTVLQKIGINSDKLRNYNESIQAYSHSVFIAEKMSNCELLIASSYNNLGLILIKTGDYDSAIEQFKLSHKIQQNHLGLNHIDTVSVYNNLACAYFKKEDYENAFENYNTFLKLFYEISNKSELNYESATAYNNIGLVHVKTKDFEKASENFKKSISIIQKLKIDYRAENLSIMNNLAGVYFKLKKYQDSLDTYLKIYELSQELHGSKSTVECLNIVKNIGHCYLNFYDFESAIKYYLISMDISIKNNGSFNLQTSECYFNLGVAYENNSDLENSLIMFKNCYEVRKIILGENDKKVTIVKNIIDRLENE